MAIAAGDKKQITAIFCGTAAGEFLPIQLIYAGKTKRCHPKFTFPSDWSITHSQKHWSNENEMIEYIEDIIVPLYIITFVAIYEGAVTKLIQKT